MTYPEGREPIKWGDLTPKHSTWEAEAKALREQNTELALQVLAAEGQAEEAYKAQQQAESVASWADIRANQAINEAKALRAENERLRAALREIVRMTGKGADAPMTAERWLDRIDKTALDALKATTAPQSATHSAKSGPGKGQTPETP